MRECRLISLLPRSSLSSTMIASAYSLIHKRAYEVCSFSQILVKACLLSGTFVLKYLWEEEGCQEIIAVGRNYFYERCSNNHRTLSCSMSTEKDMTTDAET